MKPTMGSLFAGIGGFDLGFTRAGFDVAWQVEIDPWCRKVLAKNFPDAERFDDVRECGRHNLKPVDVIAGGFPCQDISVAGKAAGIEGERSGLWSQMLRIISELRPRYVLVENVAALLGRGMGRVLGDLAGIGYDCEWQCVSAATLGLPHLRRRIWIAAYPTGERMAERWTTDSRGEAAFAMPPINVRTADWTQNPNLLPRMDDGLPGKLHRGRGIGNAVVPAIPEMYAHRIKAILDDLEG